MANNLQLAQNILPLGLLRTQNVVTHLKDVLRGVFVKKRHRVGVAHRGLSLVQQELHRVNAASSVSVALVNHSSNQLVVNTAQIFRADYVPSPVKEPTSQRWVNFCAQHYVLKGL